MKIKTGILYK